LQRAHCLRAGREQRKSRKNIAEPDRFPRQLSAAFGFNAESIYNWNDSQWTVPLNLSVSQLLRIGELPVSFAVGGRYYAEGPSGGPQWGVRFVITPLLPTGGSPQRKKHLLQNNVAREF